jgi:FkbM family methyltransferase
MKTPLHNAELALRLGRFVLTHPGLKGARTAAVRRAVRWQTTSRRGKVRARLRVGPTRLLCYPGSTGASGMLYAGLPEWDEMVFALRYLRPGDLFVDVGANVGAYSLIAATWMPSVKVIAFEPDAEAAARFEENWTLNALERPPLVRAAVGAKPGSAQFTVGLDSINHIADAGEPGGTTVPVVRLDDTVEGPALIKVDVEGFELDVFRGAHRLLTVDRPALLFELNNGRGEPVSVLLDHLRSLGYSMCRYDAGAHRLVALEHRRLRDGKTDNAVAVVDVDEAQQRLSESPLGDSTRPPVRVTMSIETY